MPPETSAILTLLGFAAAFVALIFWRALRCPTGWRLWVMHVITRTYCSFIYHFRTNRRCPFLNASPAIIIANHRSPTDPLLIAGDVDNMRPLGFMMAREYYEIPSLRLINTGHECIPVARDGKDLAATRAALRRLQEGKILGIFPEGGINTGPGLRPANTGVAWLALRSRAPVYPIFIENAPTGDTMVEPFYKFTRVKVHYGDAIDLSAYYGRTTTAELLEEVTAILMSHIARLGGLPEPGSLDQQPVVNHSSEDLPGLALTAHTAG